MQVLSRDLPEPSLLLLIVANEISGLERSVGILILFLKDWEQKACLPKPVSF